MKIEMGESLFYSWLRHVKECQVVQTNWKISSSWELSNEQKIIELFEFSDKFFESKYNFRIFKQNTSLSQVLGQCECDAIGISVKNEKNSFYAVDIAFHGGGLNYGSKEETVMKVIAKGIKTAMCLYGYMNCKDGEIIFASPKINNAILEMLLPCIEDINFIFAQLNLDFTMRIITNNEFNASVLQPILLLSDEIADTSELFIRSYQMFSMFKNQANTPTAINSITSPKIPVQAEKIQYNDEFKELKIGRIADVVLRKMLENGVVTPEEIEFLQQKDYSKQFFDLQFPVLIKTNSTKKESRYYSKLLTIYGETYRLCSEWFEVATNNDRPYLIKWIENHKIKD